MYLCILIISKAKSIFPHLRIALALTQRSEVAANGRIQKLIKVSTQPGVLIKPNRGDPVSGIWISIVKALIKVALTKGSDNG